MSKTISVEHFAALDRLLEIAERDNGQSRRVRNFLFAWWNAVELGGFDFTDFWSVDTEIARDMLAVLEVIVWVARYPDNLGYGKQFEKLVTCWRPSAGSTELD
jgi:hypothetical protein